VGFLYVKHFGFLAPTEGSIFACQQKNQGMPTLMKAKQQVTEKQGLSWSVAVLDMTRLVLFHMGKSACWLGHLSGRQEAKGPGLARLSAHLPQGPTGERSGRKTCTKTADGLLDWLH